MWDTVRKETCKHHCSQFETDVCFIEISWIHVHLYNAMVFWNCISHALLWTTEMYQLTGFSRKFLHTLHSVLYSDVKLLLYDHSLKRVFV